MIAPNAIRTKTSEAGSTGRNRAPRRRGQARVPRLGVGRLGSATRAILSHAPGGGGGGGAIEWCRTHRRVRGGFRCACVFVAPPAARSGSPLAVALLACPKAEEPKAPPAAAEAAAPAAPADGALGRLPNSRRGRAGAGGAGGALSGPVAGGRAPVFDAAAPGRERGPLPPPAPDRREPRAGRGVGLRRDRVAELPRARRHDVGVARLDRGARRRDARSAR